MSTAQTVYPEGYAIHEYESGPVTGCDYYTENALR